MGFTWKSRFDELRALIRCANAHLILGNHDQAFEDEERDAGRREIFQSVRRLFYGRIGGKTNGRKFVLCHYAMRTWPWQHRGGIHLYGHSHGNLPDDPNSRSLDVGVDTCLFGHERYTPYSFEEICQIMDTHKQFVPLDHHGRKDIE